MSPGLQSSEAAEEDGHELEIRQHNGVRHVEFPLTRGYSSKHGSQVREERMGECDGLAKGGYGGLYSGIQEVAPAPTCPLPKGGVIRLQRIYNFWCSMLVFTSFAYCFRYTLWHFYAFSGTNLLTSCHSASFLFSAVFVFQKWYTGNILRIGRNKFLKSYFTWKLPVTTQDFIKFWGKFFAFVLLEMIGNSQGFKTFWVYLKALLENYFKLSIIFLEEFLRERSSIQILFPFLYSNLCKLACKGVNHKCVLFSKYCILKTKFER
jgi:hypothetical protein